MLSASEAATAEGPRPGPAVAGALEARPPLVRVEGLTMAYGTRVVQRDLTFTVHRADIFIIMGGSGSGKSTLMRHMVGLDRPAAGRVAFEDVSLFDATPEAQAVLRRRMGVMYQQGALWSSMTLAQNITLALGEHTRLPPAEAREVAALKLALVGLNGFDDYFPAEISGGMRKRAAIARAMALDPPILFLDEPSAGLDPVSSKRLDELVSSLRDTLGTTIVIVTHELASILSIGDNAVFLDGESRTMIASGHPRLLLAESEDARVLHFLTRGERP